jgi:hypothetical protein
MQGEGLVALYATLHGTVRKSGVSAFGVGTAVAMKNTLFSQRRILW